MSARGKLHVLLAEDHALVRDGLKRLVNEQPDMEVIAEAADGHEAVLLAQRHEPDVALIDVSMPGYDGVTVARELTRRCPRIRIVGVTRHNDEAFLKRMFDAGAVGYVLKQSPSTELLRAMRAVVSGQRYIDASMRAVHASSPAFEDDGQCNRRTEPLAESEEAVLRLLAASWTNQRIADHLAMDTKNVQVLRTAAMAKAGLQTRLQIIEYARSRGWLP